MLRIHHLQRHLRTFDTILSTTTDFACVYDRNGRVAYANQALLDFWGLPNLQVINRAAHAAKCAIEARHRRVARSLETELT